MKTISKRVLKRMVIACAVVACLGLSVVLGINAYVKSYAKEKILSPEQAAELNVDCILILGCGVWEGGVPSHMLEDRLLQGIELYTLGTSDRLLMSGDHGRIDYDEVNVMKNFAIERDIPSENIFMDHAGFSTYESMYRAKEIFEVETVVIVTQQYHLYRALYVAEKLGLEAYGVPSDPRPYAGQITRDLREVLARNKDFFMAIFQPEPTYLGQTIPISGDGNLTSG